MAVGTESAGLCQVGLGVLDERVHVYVAGGRGRPVDDPGSVAASGDHETGLLQLAAQTMNPAQSRWQGFLRPGRLPSPPIEARKPSIGAADVTHGPVSVTRVQRPGLCW